MLVEINNLTTSRVNKKFFEKIAKRILAEENEKKLGLSIALVSRTIIKKLNRKYRKKNKTTDVLSFFYRARRSRAKVKEEDEVFFTQGEIVICPEVVKKNAEKFGIPFRKELIRILIHGILHLLGYDDEKNEKRTKLMEEKQNYYLELCQKLK